MPTRDTRASSSARVTWADRKTRCMCSKVRLGQDFRVEFQAKGLTPEKVGRPFHSVPAITLAHSGSPGRGDRKTAAWSPGLR